MQSITKSNDPHHGRSSLEKNWGKLEQQSEELINLFEQQDWEQAAILSKQRHHLIIRHFNVFPINENTAAFYQQKIPKMQNLDKNLKDLSQKNYQLLQKQLQTIDTGKIAIKAYQTSNEH